MAIAGNENHVRTARGGRVLGAHEHFTLVFQPLAFDPMSLVVLADREVSTLDASSSQFRSGSCK